VLSLDKTNRCFGLQHMASGAQQIHLEGPNLNVYMVLSVTFENYVILSLAFIALATSLANHNRFVTAPTKCIRSMKVRPNDLSMICKRCCYVMCTSSSGEEPLHHAQLELLPV
jgi:hypothetical protein